MHLQKDLGGARTCGLVLSRHVEDAIGINVEDHIDLRHAAWCWRDSGELKLAEQVVVTRPRPLTLKYLQQTNACGNMMTDASYQLAHMEALLATAGSTGGQETP